MPEVATTGEGWVSTANGVLTPDHPSRTFVEIVQLISREHCSDPWQDRFGWPWVCTRPRHGRRSRHMAENGSRIMAAWPGDHPPTPADLGDPDAPEVVGYVVGWAGREGSAVLWDARAMPLPVARATLDLAHRRGGVGLEIYEVRSVDLGEAPPLARPAEAGT